MGPWGWGDMGGIGGKDLRRTTTHYKSLNLEKVIETSMGLKYPQGMAELTLQQRTL
jgi:hypothetical protein